MRKALALLLALCSSLLSLLATNEARQGDRLWEPISSPSPPLFASSSWEADLVAAEGIPPVYVGQQDGLKEADKIDALPGQPEGVDFDQYAGYVTVNEEQGRALFYYFVESPHDPSSKPLVLWMNGGPGCSSLGYGAMEELGPFRVKSDGRTLFRNPYSWNEVANVLFLESPAGVGFSYSNTTSDYNQSGDKRSAQDALTFLVNWLERFPQYKTRDFFITGESFAGHYVPQLASAILSYNKMANKSTINLKGIAIGNAYLDGSPTLFNTRLEGYYILLWTHALISDQTYLAIQSSCKYPNGNLTGNCSAAFSKIRSDTGDIDPYNVYWPTCRDIPERTTGSIEHFDPCSDAYIQFYLNLPEVQKSLHANVTRLPYQWIACSNIVSWSNWKDIASSTLPTIKELVGSGLRVWVYSGDTDAVVSVTSTKLSLKMLQLPVETPWRPWQSSKQVAGYVEGYKGLVFATVRGAGHEVPSYQPERALTLFTSFLQGKLPPP